MCRLTSGVGPGTGSRRDIGTECVSSDVWRRFGDWVERVVELFMTIVVDATTPLYTSCATIAPARAIVAATSLQHVATPHTTSTTPNRAVPSFFTLNRALLPNTTYLFNLSCTTGLRLSSYSGTPHKHSDGPRIPYKHTRGRRGQCRRRNSTHVIHAKIDASPSSRYPSISIGLGLQQFSFTTCAVVP